MTTRIFQRTNVFYGTEVYTNAAVALEILSHKVSLELESLTAKLGEVQYASSTYGQYASSTYGQIAHAEAQFRGFHKLHRSRLHHP